MPEAHEVEAWGEPTFRVRNKIFAMYASAGSHHGAGNHAVWCNSTRTNQDLLVHREPDRYLSPPHVGPKGWIDIRLDDDPDWTQVTALLRDAWKLRAPKRLAALLAAE